MKPFQLSTNSPKGALAYFNGKYQVLVRYFSDDWLVLSIRREDRKPIMDWRDVQWIKNQLLGDEAEMIQLFPAESRLVDTANQYYFYSPVQQEPPFRFPLGFTERMVTERIQLTQPGAGTSEQRPFAEHVRPPDLAEKEREAVETLLECGGRFLGSGEPLAKPEDRG